MLGPEADLNSRVGILPSVLRPTSTITKSFSTAVTLPFITVPSERFILLILSSSKAAKSSTDGFNLSSSFFTIYVYSPIHIEFLTFMYVFYNKVNYIINFHLSCINLNCILSFLKGGNFSINIPKIPITYIIFDIISIYFGIILL